MTAARVDYNLEMGGSADGRNTRDPVVYAAWKPGFEPMRAVKLENTGDTDVVNPWILVNGKRDWRTTASIAGEALREYGDPRAMSDRDKARAIWEFLRHHRFHATTGDMEVRDPVKMFNVYGFSLCGDNAPVLMELWQAVGLKTRRGYPTGHCVAEAWYEGGWHMLDGDESILFLDRDNRTVLPEKAVARDHDLSKRAYKSAYLPALYTYDATHTGDFPAHTGHRMDMTLRPGESIEWRWSQGEKQHYAPNPGLFLLKSNNLHQWGPNAWATLRNGKWVYQPRLDKAAGSPVVWRIRTPYAIVGGTLRAKVPAGSGGRAVFSASYDGKSWKPVATSGQQINASLDFLFPSPGDAHYEFFIRLETAVALEAISIESDLQMAPLSMPSLELGTNRIRYSDESEGGRQVKTTVEWVERDSARPAAAPARAMLPADAAEVEGTAPRFQWSEAPDPDGGNAAAYHFELSDEPAMRWALSPAFSVVQPETAWSAPSAGLLNPGQTYYWRVRAKSRSGVWGTWSPNWKFVPRSAGTPVHLRFEERDPGRLTLVWDGNPVGRKTARYRVYASDEKGFSVRDIPYDVQVGNQKTGGQFPGRSKVKFDANFRGETSATFLDLNPTQAFYRVVAVDEQGNRSGSSDYTDAPRPWIYTEPLRSARVGIPYRYEARTIRSIGDLTYRHAVPDNQYQSAFWDADAPMFSIDSEMPRCGNFDATWLHIDSKTGVLSGTPGEADVREYQINLRVEIKGKVHVQSFPLTVLR